MADLLDQKFKIWNFEFGLDPIIGLIPVVGDIIPLVFSGYIVWIGVINKIPKWAIVKMCFNIAVDFLVGTIPILGDILDFALKSNHKNIGILDKHTIS